LTSQQSWQFYIPVLLISLGCVMPFVRRGDDVSLQKQLFIFAVMGLFCVLPCWLWTENKFLFLGFGVLFFVLFNYLEASMPAMVSKIAPVQRRGLIIGVYSSCQFLGLFVGGALGGYFMERWGIVGIVGFSIVLLFFWLLSILGLNFNHNEELSWQEV
jgi:predicted MFS family arabinose efflux permease